MATERQHRLDDRELRRLLDELARPESEVEVPGKWTRAERLDQVARGLRHRAATSASNVHAGSRLLRPGQRALVGEMLTAAPKLEFHDCRALALRDVLSRLGRHRQLQEETLAAADPQVAGRVGRREYSAHVTPQGLAMWGAANQRAVTLYRRATAAGIGAPETRPVAEAIGSIGTGVPLPDDVRRKLELALGVSLESVRLHTGTVARDAAAAVCAEAFTVGEDIFFPAYDPTSSRCQETLAHEVVHCIQWRQGRIGPAAGGTGVSRPDDPLEREAEHQAKSIVARAFHGPAEPTRMPAAGRSGSHGARPPTIDRPPAAFPVAMMLGPVGPVAAGFTGSSAMVMRRERIKGQVEDRPLEVPSLMVIEQRYADLEQSLLQAPSHILEEGGEYASLLKDHWKVTGAVFAGVVLFELGSRKLLKAKDGRIQAIGIGIKVLLAMAGAFASAKSIQATQDHAEKWVDGWWNSNGDQGAVTEASRECVRMLGSFLAACFSIGATARSLMSAFAAFTSRLSAQLASTTASSTTSAAKQANARDLHMTNEGGKYVYRAGPSNDKTSGVPTLAGQHPPLAGQRLLPSEDDWIARLRPLAFGSPEPGESAPEIEQGPDQTAQSRSGAPDEDKEPSSPQKEHSSPSRAPVRAKDRDSEIAELLAVQRAKHPHLAKPIPWHGTEPLELSPQGTTGRVAGAGEHALPPHEVERIMARIDGLARGNLSPEEADLFLRDLKNRQQNPIQSPHRRRMNVDASDFISEAQWIHDRVTEAIHNGYFAKLEVGREIALRKAERVLRKAETIVASRKMSAADRESLWSWYVDALKRGRVSNNVELPDRFPTLQTGPTSSYPGLFGVERNNAAGVLNIPQRGYLAPDAERLGGWQDFEFPLHDGSHVNAWATEFAPSFHSYLAAMDRRIDFAEAFAAFKSLFTPREQSLLEKARFVARWENHWAPTAEHTWAATREPIKLPKPEASNHVVQQSLAIFKAQGRTDVTREEMEEIVLQLRHFSSAYLDSVADGALRRRNALFQEAIVNRPWGGELRYLMARMGAPVANDPQWQDNPNWIRITLGRPTFSPEEVSTFLKDDEIVHAFPRGKPQLAELRRFVETFIGAHPVPLIDTDSKSAASAAPTTRTGPQSF